VCARECIAGRSITVTLADPLNGVSYNTTITMEGEAADCRATAILVSYRAGIAAKKKLSIS
jgi:hypothetical protein